MPFKVDATSYSTNSKVRIVQDIYVLKSNVMVRWNGINKKDENVQKIEFACHWKTNDD